MGVRLEKLKFSSLADAKAKLSSLISSLKDGDVVITRNGVPTAVLMDYEKYVKIMKFLDEVRDVYLLDVGEPSRMIEVDMEENEEV